MKLFPEAMFCVAEQNPTGWFDTLQMDPEKVRHITRTIDGGFRKTALLNAAIEEVPDADIIVMVDGDVFLNEKWSTTYGTIGKMVPLCFRILRRCT